MKNLSGYDAIEYAEREGLTLSKYADPTEDARDGLSIEEARDIAREDPALIYIRIMKPKYHGQDKDAAIARARENGGVAIYSAMPDTDPHQHQQFGYWSDAGDAMIRVWETQVYPDPEKD